MKKKWLAWLLIFAVIMGSAACMPVSAAAAAKLSSTSKMIEVGKSFTLTVSGTKQKASFSSADKAVATVTAKGVVTAKKVGKTTITAKVGRQTLKCTVRITYKRTKFTLRGQTFTLAIPPTWTYRYIKGADQEPFVEFYYKYMYQHYDGKGSLMFIAAYTDKELADYGTNEGCVMYGKIGKYNFGAYYGWGSALSGNQEVDDTYLKLRRQSASIAATFQPGAKTAKQKAYNAYFQFLVRPMIAGNPFALAYITNDNIPELIVDTSRYSYDGCNTIIIYTFKNGIVQQLCTTGRWKNKAGYYFKKNVAFGDNGVNNFDVHYYNVAKNIELLSYNSLMLSGRRVFSYFNASGKQIKKATFNAALKKYTGGKKAKHYTFHENTLKNRKKYLHN